MVITRLFRRNDVGRGGIQGVVPDPRHFLTRQEEANEFNLCPPEEIYIKSIPLIMLSDIQRAV
ncbi:MAG: hypothetical protein KIH01_05435, partial [Candidatus Freyarchaeota archaeon]|nr:hypothetical protein [Candidatus Jordarchaeia archaeon]